MDDICFISTNSEKLNGGCKWEICIRFKLNKSNECFTIISHYWCYSWHTNIVSYNDFKIKFSGSFDGRSDDTKIFTLTDDSGYYVTGKDSSNLANIWKYLYSSSLNAQWQQITHFSKFVYGQLKLSDTEFFMLSNDPVTAYPLHFYKFKFSLTSPTWAMSMPCSESVWYTGASESLLSSDSSKIYSFYSFGNLLSLYFTTFVSSDGSILSTRYKSGTYTCGTSGGAYGSVVMDNYIITSFWITYLVIIDITTNEFTIKETNGIKIYNLEIDKIGRYVNYIMI